jgi:hypothetical protein
MRAFAHQQSQMASSSFHAGALSWPERAARACSCSGAWRAAPRQSGAAHPLPPGQVEQTAPAPTTVHACPQPAPKQFTCSHRLPLHVQSLNILMLAAVYKTIVGPTSSKLHTRDSSPEANSARMPRRCLPFTLPVSSATVTRLPSAHRGSCSSRACRSAAAFITPSALQH